MADKETCMECGQWIVEGSTICPKCQTPTK